MRYQVSSRKGTFPALSANVRVIVCLRLSSHGRIQENPRAHRLLAIESRSYAYRAAKVMSKSIMDHLADQDGFTLDHIGEMAEPMIDVLKEELRWQGYDMVANHGIPQTNLALDHPLTGKAVSTLHLIAEHVVMTAFREAVNVPRVTEMDTRNATKVMQEVAAGIVTLYGGSNGSYFVFYLRAELIKDLRLYTTERYERELHEAMLEQQEEDRAIAEEEAAKARKEKALEHSPEPEDAAMQDGITEEISATQSFSRGLPFRMG